MQISDADKALRYVQGSLPSQPTSNNGLLTFWFSEDENALPAVVEVRALPHYIEISGLVGLPDNASFQDALEEIYALSPLGVALSRSDADQLTVRHIAFYEGLTDEHLSVQLSVVATATSDIAMNLFSKFS